MCPLIVPHLPRHFGFFFYFLQWPPTVLVRQTRQAVRAINQTIFPLMSMAIAGNTKGGSITVPLTSCLTGLESALWQQTIFVFICKTDQSKPVKQEVNSTVILPPLVFPGYRPLQNSEAQNYNTVPCINLNKTIIKVLNLWKNLIHAANAIPQEQSNVLMKNSTRLEVLTCLHIFG